MATHAHMHDHKHGEAGSVRDPVCAMTVDPQAGKPTLEHDGCVFHFCGPRCRDTFEAAPEDYIEATDPVCGMSVERATAQHVVKHADQRFYFCSARCKAILQDASWQ